MIDCYVGPRAPDGGTPPVETIELRVTEHADLANLKEAVERLVLRFGTVECGIAGFDVFIRTEREARQAGEEIAPGVKAVTHTR
jgi:hypothetical protein